eukprot:gene25638-65240_t
MADAYTDVTGRNDRRLRYKGLPLRPLIIGGGSAPLGRHLVTRMALSGMPAAVILDFEPRPGDKGVSVAAAARGCDAGLGD